MSVSRRVLPAAALAGALLTTYAPGPTVIAGDADTASPATSSDGAISTAIAGSVPAAPPSGAAARPPAGRPPAGTTAVQDFAAGNLDPEDRPAPQGVLPRRVRVPSIGVDAVVGRLGLNDDGSIEVPEGYDDAGWWEYSPRPGRTGTSVLLGHVDSTAGPGVFFDLEDVRPGDEIHVDGEDRTVTFVVTAVEQYRKANFPAERVLGATPRASLRLITCGGAFDANWGHYLDNVVVYAERVEN